MILLLKYLICCPILNENRKNFTVCGVNDEAINGQILNQNSNQNKFNDLGQFSSHYQLQNQYLAYYQNENLTCNDLPSYNKLFKDKN